MIQIELPSIEDFNTLQVIMGSTVLGITSGVIGTFAILRGRALIGDTLAHAALPGLCLSFLIFGVKNVPILLLGAFLSGILGVVSVNLIRNYTKLKDDTALALVLGTFFGIGITLSRMLQNSPSGNQAGLDGYILGKAASMNSSDLMSIFIIAIITLLFTILSFKELRVLCFDENFARAIGIRVKRLDLILMSVITLCTVVGLPAVGVVLIAAMLIIPGAAARYWSENLSTVTLLASIFGGLSAASGVFISAAIVINSGEVSIPTGPAIILSATTIFITSLLFAPRRGALSRALRQRKFRESIQR